MTGYSLYDGNSSPPAAMATIQTVEDTGGHCLIFYQQGKVEEDRPGGMPPVTINPLRNLNAGFLKIYTIILSFYYLFRKALLKN
jgi:hypothetical protein